mgnify:FL=1|tara:strand:+ start:302 stop:694 length:393 start_codon:yes stop_codon:yes gene_type:complete
MSTLKADTIQSTAGGAATLTKQSAAKAFGVFDQRGDKLGANTGGDTFNVSSFSDTSTGIFSTSLTNNMSSTQYASITNSHYTGLNGSNSRYSRFSASSAYASGSFTTASQHQNDSSQDNYLTINVHGDLA